MEASITMTIEIYCKVFARLPGQFDPRSSSRDVPIGL